METMKKLLKVKATLFGMELFFQDMVQEMLTREIKEQTDELKAELLEKAKNLDSLEQLNEIKKELKTILKSIEKAEEMDKENEEENED